MPGDKVKKTSEKKIEKKEEEAPELVEVYGDGEKIEAEENPVDVNKDNSKIKSDKIGSEEEPTFKNDESEESLPVKHLRPLNDPSEVEPTTLKTEIVTADLVEQEEVKSPSISSLEKDKKKPVLSEDEQAFDEEIGNQKKSVRNIFNIGLIVFLVIFGLTGWAFYLKTKWLPSETITNVIVEATPEPTTTLEPTPTPNPLSKDKVIMEILNGSGVPGLAGGTAAIFEDLGYTIDKVGNGDDVDETEVYVRESDEDVLWEVLEDVNSELSVSSISGYLDNDSDVLVRIVLGQ